MTGFLFKSNTGRGLRSPAITIGLEDRVFGDTPIHPGSRFEGDTFFCIVFQYLYLGDVRDSEVDAEVTQRTVFGMEQRERQHSSVEDKFGTVPLQSEVFETFQCNPHSLGIGLVVIGDVVDAFGGTCFVEVVFSFGKT